MVSTLTLRIALAGLGLAIMATSGCGKDGNPFAPPPPDEFAVIKRKPLQMPPRLGLPQPNPGAPSPLDIDPNREAEIALLGRPLPERTTQSVSTSEQVLLRSADAASASSDVRVQLEQEEAETGPYEPPTVFELLGMSGPGGEDDPSRLNPEQEARRLQAEGVIAPSDPDAPPPEAEEQVSAEDGRIPLRLGPGPSRAPQATDAPE